MTKLPSAPVLSPQRRRIVSAVIRAGGLTRAAVARELSLSRSSLSTDIAALLASGVLTAEGRAASTGGRPGELLQAGGPAIGVLAGVDIDFDRVGVAITTLGGAVLAQDTRDLAVAGDPAEAMSAAADMVRRLLPGQGPLLAIGVSIAADVERTTGYPIAAPTMPSWAGWPVCEQLAEQFDARTFIDNDVNVLALAEATAPASARKLGDTFIVLKISHGLGCGIVVDDRVFRGSGGFAGDLGHICVDRADRTICACGNRGCLEVLAGEPAIIRDAQALAASGASPTLASMLAEHGRLTLELIGAASAAGDAAVGSLLRDVGNRIGFVLAGVVSFFNPSSVAVNSGLGAGEDILVNAIRELIYQRSLPVSTRDLQITRTHFGRDAGAVTAAVLAGHGFLGSAGSVAEARRAKGRAARARQLSG